MAAKLPRRLVQERSRWVDGERRCVRVDLSACQIAALYEGVAVDVAAGPHDAPVRGIHRGQQHTTSHPPRRTSLIPSQAGPEVQVAELVLSVNDLETVAGLDALVHLRALDLSLNQIRALPVMTLPAIQSLILAHNYLSTVAPLLALRSLTHIDVSANQLTALDGIASMPSLTTLVADNNRIASLAGLRGSRSLRSVSVAHNSIASLDGCQDIPTLARLDASHNSISDLNATLRELAQSHVLELQLHHNAIAASPQYRFAVPLSCHVAVFDGDTVSGSYREVLASQSTALTVQQRVDEARRQMRSQVPSQPLLHRMMRTD